MPWSSYLVISAICVLSIFLFRVVPLLTLADRKLPSQLQEALDYVPVAAFAALVANDLFTPDTFSLGVWPTILPFVASLPVVILAVKTHSLALCIVVGVAVYALLLLV